MDTIGARWTKLKSVKEFFEWTKNSSDIFSLEGAHSDKVKCMASLDIFTVSSSNFVLHCPVEHGNKYMVEVQCDSSLISWALALNEFIQDHTVQEMTLGAVLERAAVTLFKHTEVGTVREVSLEKCCFLLDIFQKLP